MTSLTSLSESWWHDRSSLKVLALRAPALDDLRRFVFSAREHRHIFVSPAEVLYREMPFDYPPVLVTFDGALTVIQESVRWLVDHGVACLIHAEAVPHAELRATPMRLMKPEEIMQLSQHPLVDFGCFAGDENFEGIDDDSAVRKIIQTRKTLQGWTGSPPISLGFTSAVDMKRAQHLASRTAFDAVFTCHAAHVRLPLPVKDTIPLCLNRWPGLPQVLSQPIPA